MTKSITISCLTLLALIVSAESGQAQSNWLDQFLSRYRPADVQFPKAPGQMQQTLADRVRTGELSLSVNDVIVLMLNNNVDIGVDRLPLLSSQYEEQSFQGRFEPNLHLGANANKITEPADTQLSSPINKLQTSTLDVGYAQTLSSGTDIGVDVLTKRAAWNSPFTVYNPAWYGTVTYSFSQHLLRDYGRAANTAQIRIAKNNREISAVKFEQEVIDLVVQAQKTYWDLVFGMEDLKVKQRSLDLAQRTLSDNQKEVREGSMAGADVVQSQAEVAIRRDALIVATYTQTVSENEIKKLISSEKDPGMISGQLLPIQSAPKPSDADVPPVEEAIRTALENRPEVRLMELELKNKQIAADQTKGQLLPVVDLNGQFSQNGVGGTFLNRPGFGAAPVSVVPGGFTDAFGQVVQFKDRGYGLGFNVQLPLENKTAQAENGRALTEERIAAARITSTSQQVALEVRNALALVEMNRARVMTAQDGRELAEKTLEYEQKKLENGASSTRFVLEAQRDLTQAQTNEISTLVNYSKALADLDRAMGITLKKNKIQLE